MLNLLPYASLMPRAASLRITRWLRTDSLLDRPWTRDANCGEHQDLPWTSNYTPTSEEMAQMTAVCEPCPVRNFCADYGLKTTGGFYAGVWLPWPSNTESAGVRKIRRRSRRQLQRLRVAWIDTDQRFAADGTP